MASASSGTFGYAADDRTFIADLDRFCATACFSFLLPAGDTGDFARPRFCATDKDCDCACGVVAETDGRIRPGGAEDVDAVNDSGGSDAERFVYAGFCVARGICESSRGRWVGNCGECCAAVGVAVESE